MISQEDNDAFNEDASPSNLDRFVVIQISPYIQWQGTLREALEQNLDLGKVLNNDT